MNHIEKCNICSSELWKCSNEPCVKKYCINSRCRKDENYNSSKNIITLESYKDIGSVVDIYCCSKCSQNHTVQEYPNF